MKSRSMNSCPTTVTESGTAITESNYSRRANPSWEEQYAIGESLRDHLPLDKHARWPVGCDRPNPLDLVKRSLQGPIPELLPLRYGRLLKSPFTFYLGAALNMAADLATTSDNGVRVQACGDCHLCNFGAFATPDGRVVADLNNLDETLPAPWEWDVKRLAASLVLACRDRGFSDDHARDAVLACVASYRERMSEFSRMHVLDVWYSNINVDTLAATVRDSEARKRGQKRLKRAREVRAMGHDLPSLVRVKGKAPRIKDQPPLIYHPHGTADAGFAPVLENAFAEYRQALPKHRAAILYRYDLVDFALKVTDGDAMCGVALLMADDEDVVFLQVKEARRSVLEEFAGRSACANQGQRVVEGIQLLRSASDLFLGWTTGRDGRHFYVRQLQDMILKPLVEVFTGGVMIEYAAVCGWILAHAHARSGESARISGYLGGGDQFDEAIADFSFAYADQAEWDHGTIMQVVRSGELEIA